VIEDLQHHADRSVYKAASDILSSFFDPVKIEIQPRFSLAPHLALQVEDEADEHGM
jgi:hypothetical protein